MSSEVTGSTVARATATAYTRQSVRPCRPAPAARRPRARRRRWSPGRSAGRRRRPRRPAPRARRRSTAARQRRGPLAGGERRRAGRRRSARRAPSSTVVATTLLVRNGTGATARPSSSSTTAASRAERAGAAALLGHEQPGQAEVGGQRLPQRCDQRRGRRRRGQHGRRAGTGRPAGRARLARRSSSTSVVEQVERRSSGQVLPGDVLVDAVLGRQAEHPLGDDVAQDLRRAALDRVALGAQVAVAGVPAGEVDAARAGPSSSRRSAGPPRRAARAPGR